MGKGREGLVRLARFALQADLPADETSPRFPPQLYEIIENFCLGTRRLELFGSKSKAREGWVTLGANDTNGRGDVQEYSPEKYSEMLQQNVDALGRNVLPQVEGM
jgi:hypothetical protein